MGSKNLDSSKIIKLLLIVLFSLPLAGCSVFQDDEYIDDKPWSRPAGWENQGLNIPY
ncbi:MAG: hypothetical protein NE330_12745 [Lentisphaeraceae bacterium]|nr:hypothetical protein [Lentisphaeraceae bacterium]